MNLVWRGPLTDPSGYAEGGRAWVRGLVEAGAAVRVEPHVWHHREAVTPAERERLADLMATDLPHVDATVQNTLGRLLDPYAPGRLRVARTMFETDRIPADWVARCNQMDDVWVPTAQSREAFVASGVDGDRLAVIPEPFELDRLDGDAEPLDIPEAHGTVVLAAFDWTLRKGWDALLDAWCDAFRPDDDVTLVLKVWSTSRGRSREEIEAEVVAHLTRRGHDPARVPDIVLLDRLIPARAMSRLYAACHAYCAPARGEGWGRPLTSAMAAGRPVIATAWSGPAAFVDAEVGWPLPYRLVDVPAEAVAEVPAYAGHRWAEPDHDGLVAALRELHADPLGAAARGAAARRRAAAFGHDRVARMALERLAQVAPRPRPRAAAGAGPRTVLEGALLDGHSLAGVNRELARALLRRGGVDLALVDAGGAALDADAPALAPLRRATRRLLPGPPEVTVRHVYPPSFAPVASGRLVCVMPWEFGPVPRGWVPRIAAGVDEVWVPSRHTREGYLESGVAPERVAVVPNGVDGARFRPGAPPVDLGDAAPGYRFLFVGGLLWRKGIDLLLDAYAQAFTRADDVTLVLKDFGALGPYVPQDALARVRALVADPRAPRVAHFTGTLPEADMPGLYTACDCLVHPYRGEGYALPVAEAMACGLPVVIPERGAARDYADADTAVLVHSDEALHGPVIGGLLLAGPARMSEVRVDALAARMRQLYDGRIDGPAVGARASAHMRAHHTWDHAAEVAAERITALAGSATPTRRRRAPALLGG